MGNNHNLSFFGQKTGMIFSTKSRNEMFLYIRCLKKKKSGDWENFNESKTVKLSLIEIISIADILNKKRKIWSTFHSFNNIKTPISLAWDEYDSDLLWINIDDYSRPLNYPENELLRRLINHIIDEKIKFATVWKEKELPKEMGGNSSLKNDIQNKNNFPTNKIKNQDHKKNYNQSESTTLQGKIKIEREKAVLVVLENGQEIWFPRSTIMNSYESQSKNFQKFNVKNWVLKKRNLSII
ncbi:MAG: hypothetical protein ACTSWY_00395 [Promethearchaeota archaeon]